MTATAFLPSPLAGWAAPAIRSPDGDRSWRDLERASLQLACGWQRDGLVEEDRVAVMTRNRPEFVEVMLACLRGGNLLVPINWHLTTPEVAHILADSDAKAVICDREHAAVAGQAAATAGLAPPLVVAEDYEAWRDAQDEGPLSNQRAGGPMFYTSGTTGHPKGVDNSAYKVPVDQAWDFWRNRGDLWHYRRPGAHLVACPAYHAAPLANIYFALAFKQSLTIMPRFDAEDFLRQVESHGITTTHVVPTQMARLLRLDPAIRQAHDLSSLETVIHGAAPCPPWVKQAMIDWLGPVMVEYYAFSESVGSTFASSQEWIARPGTVGRPAGGAQLQVVSEAGETLSPGEIGTLYLRRPDGSLPRYHKAPEKTAASQREGGWFSVGDVGWVDDEGYLYLVDRKIDMIISGGANIYPAEIEAALSAHPAVADCAVFGVPDEEWGEQTKAAVLLHPDQTASEADLAAWCRERLAAFKCPKSIDFLTSLPRDEAGKLKKRLLRDPYWEGRDRQI